MPEQKAKRRPALTPEEREQELILLAEEAAENLLRSGKAPASIINTLLKRGSTREQIEQENLRLQKELTAAKTENLRQVQRMDELYEQAIRSMKRYQGDIEDDEQEL